MFSQAESHAREDGGGGGCSGPWPLSLLWSLPAGVRYVEGARVAGPDDVKIQGVGPTQGSGLLATGP